LKLSTIQEIVINPLGLAAEQHGKNGFWVYIEIGRSLKNQEGLLKLSTIQEILINTFGLAATQNGVKWFVLYKNKNGYG
jgi:hypothetical protein